MKIQFVVATRPARSLRPFLAGLFFLRLRFNNSGDYLNVSVDSPQILAEEEIQEIPPQEENNDQKRYRIKREERQPHDFRLSYVPAVV